MSTMAWGPLLLTLVALCTGDWMGDRGRALGQAPVPECGQWVHWCGDAGAPGWEVTLCPGAGATRHPRGPGALPPTTLRIGPRAPPGVQAQTHILRPGDHSPRGSPPPLLCALSHSCLWPGFRSVSPVTSGPSVGSPRTLRVSLYTAPSWLRGRTEGTSGTRIPLNQGQVRTVMTPWMQPPDCAGRGSFLLH